jgi:hypothetical protein
VDDLDRTDLAWERSVLAMGAIGLLLLRRVLPFEEVHPWAGTIILIVAGALGLVALGYRRHRTKRDHPSRLALKLVSASATVVGLAALGVALTS